MFNYFILFLLFQSFNSTVSYVKINQILSKSIPKNTESNFIPMLRPDHSEIIKPIEYKLQEKSEKIYQPILQISELIFIKKPDENPKSYVYF